MDELYEDGEHYDRIHCEDDLQFWPNVAEEFGSPILELGCGTGRIALELASAEHRVFGIDRSPHMFARAREKASGRGLSVEFIEGDFRAFSIPTAFKTVIFPANTLCHVHTRLEFEQLTRSVRNSLTGEGVFVLDVFVPNPLILIRDPEGRYPFGEYTTDSGTTRITSCNRYDAATQINHITTYTQTGDNHPIEGSLDLRMYYPQELDALLTYNGFSIIDKFGSAERDPFGPDSHQQLIICRKT
jgi:SAM-dependent methyltransferase